MNKTNDEVDYPWKKKPAPEPPAPQLVPMKLLLPRSIGSFAEGITVGQTFSIPEDEVYALVKDGTAEPLHAEKEPRINLQPKKRKWKLLHAITVASHPGCAPGDTLKLTDTDAFHMRCDGRIELAEGETAPDWYRR